MNTAVVQRLAAHPYGAVLRIAAVRYLLAAVVLTSLANGALLVAVPWGALQVNGSVSPGLAVAAASVAATLPGIPVSLLLTSRFHRFSSRRVLMLDSLLRTGVFGVIALMAFSHSLRLWIYALLLTASSLFKTASTGSRRVLVGQLVPQSRLLPANALMGVGIQIGTAIAGPAIGGIVVETLGTAAAFAGACATFLIVAMLTIPIPSAEAVAAHAAVGARQLFREIRRAKPLLHLLVITAIFNLLYGPVDVALPLFVRGGLAGDARLLGEMFTAFGIGALVGSLIVGVWRSPWRIETLTLVIVAGWGGAVGLLAGAHSGALAVAAFGIGGIIFGPFGAVSVTAIQEASSPSTVAPAMSLWAAIFVGSSPLGAILAGPLVAVAGARTALLVSAACTVALAMIGAAVMRRSRRSENTQLPPGPNEQDRHDHRS